MTALELIDFLEKHIEMFGNNEIHFIDEDGNEYNQFDIEEFKHAVVIFGQ